MFAIFVCTDSLCMKLIRTPFFILQLHQALYLQLQALILQAWQLQILILQAWHLQVLPLVRECAQRRVHHSAHQALIVVVVLIKMQPSNHQPFQ